MFRTCLAAAAVLVASATTAQADEVWNSDIAGMVVYEQDMGRTAILSFEGDRGRGHFYIDGLGGNYSNRGTFSGYWIDPSSDDSCGGNLQGPDGVSSNYWGQVVMYFDNPGFPSGWSMEVGECFGPPQHHVRANPR